MEAEWILYALYWAVALPVGIANLLLGLHALRSDRMGWAIVIFVAPLLGGILYYLTQYRPDRLAREEDRMWEEPPIAARETCAEWKTTGGGDDKISKN